MFELSILKILVISVAVIELLVEDFSRFGQLGVSAKVNLSGFKLID